MNTFDFVTICRNKFLFLSYFQYRRIWNITIITIIITSMSYLQKIINNRKRLFRTAVAICSEYTLRKPDKKSLGS